MTRYLTRDAILEAEDRTTEDVEVPEWGGTVKVRSLSGLERDQFEASVASIRWNGTTPTVESNRTNVRARLVSLAAVGEDGRPLFTERDLLVLGSKNAAALSRVYEVATRLSGLTDADVEELKQQLGEAPDAGSGTSSPETSG
jgi:hypothetical protein